MDPDPTKFPGTADAVDPLERYIPLAFRLALYGVCVFILVQAAGTFDEYVPLKPWPFVINMIHMWIILPMHEAGHLLFSLFGQTLHILGGSFWQVAFPLFWFVLALKQRSQAAPFALFFTGLSLMDVSLYIRDAHFMAMPLLGGDSSGHDWRNLLSSWDMLDSAETLGDAGYYGGLLMCILGIGGGIVWAVVSALSKKQFTALSPGLD